MNTGFDPTSTAGSAGRFEFVAGWLCLDFANTVNYATRNTNERLKRFDDLIAWAAQSEMISPTQAQRLAEEAVRCPMEAHAVLESARTLRRAIHHIFMRATAGQPPERPEMATLNSAIEKSAPHLHIKYAPGHFDFDWVAAGADLEQVTRPIVWSAVALLVSDRMKMVKQCQGKNCGWLFLDETRNHSRKWCDMSQCGNREKASRFYSRHRPAWG